MNDGIDDAFVLKALGRVGEAPPPGNIRDRWGHLLRLGGPAPAPRRKQFIATPVFRRPVIFAVALRFSLDGLTFTPQVPAGYAGSIGVEITKGIDQQSTPSIETFSLAANEVQPFCSVIAQSLQIVAFTEEPPDPIWVEIIAVPVDSFDCRDIVGPSDSPAFTNAVQFRFPQAPPFISPNFFTVLPAFPLRQQFTIQNNASEDLMISLGLGASLEPGVEQGSVILPGGINAIYSSDIRYTGPVTVCWRSVGESEEFLLASYIA